MTKDILDLSIVIKTFIRPECLRNMLESIRSYENAHQVRFSEVIIIDDSDEEDTRRNKKICDSFNDLTVKLFQYEFNSLGLSKGRNEALAKASASYFLLCDDDFILDVECDISKCLELLKQQDLDILGGYYKNISAPNEQKYQPLNWLGFINENDSFDTCLIFSDFYPRFCRCDIVQNFLIGDTKKVLHVGFPEDMPILEHNIFFLRAKQAGLKTGFSSSLFTRHLHLRSSKNYSKFRDRKVVNPIKKPVKGFSISKNQIVEFSDYLNIQGKEYLKIRDISAEKYDKTKYTYNINLLFCRGVMYFSILRTLHKLFNKTIMKFFNQKKLKTIRQQYPDVMSTQQTLEKLINEKKSLARFGDGEYKLILGEGLGEAGSDNEYQIFDPELSKRLAEVLQSGSSDCIVSISPMNDTFNNIPNFMDGLSYWDYYWLNHWDKIKDYFKKDYTYGSSFVSRLSVFKENSLEQIKQIWAERKVLFVVGENSHFVDEQRLFDNVTESRFLIAKGKSTFSEYDKILSKIKEHDNTWLIMLALGPTATVLAYDLSKDGYQALDIGHLPNCYLEYLGEKQAPEAEHHKGERFEYVENKHTKIQ